MVAKNVRTTISLPEDLLEQADRYVREGAARSRGELLVDALRHELRRLQREEIDRKFAALADDEELAREEEQIMAEFTSADAETAAMIDRDEAAG